MLGYRCTPFKAAGRNTSTSRKSTMVTTSGTGWPDETSPIWPDGQGTPAQAASIWAADQPAASIPLGGQLHGRPYVGPPTEPSRALPRRPLTDKVAIAYAIYSESVVAACTRFRTAQGVAWQEYTRLMQDANAAYEVEVRRASLQLDGSLAAIRIG